MAWCYHYWSLWLISPFDDGHFNHRIFTYCKSTFNITCLYVYQEYFPFLIANNNIRRVKTDFSEWTYQSTTNDVSLKLNGVNLSIFLIDIPDTHLRIKATWYKSFARWINGQTSDCCFICHNTKNYLSLFVIVYCYLFIITANPQTLIIQQIHYPTYGSWMTLNFTPYRPCSCIP